MVFFCFFFFSRCSSRPIPRIRTGISLFTRLPSAQSVLSLLSKFVHRLSMLYFQRSFLLFYNFSFRDKLFSTLSVDQSQKGFRSIILFSSFLLQLGCKAWRIIEVARNQISDYGNFTLLRIAVHYDGKRFSFCAAFRRPGAGSTAEEYHRLKDIVEAGIAEHNVAEKLFVLVTVWLEFSTVTNGGVWPNTIGPTGNILQ